MTKQTDKYLSFLCVLATVVGSIIIVVYRSGM